MVIEGNLKTIPAMDNKNLNGVYSNIDVEMEITTNFPEDLWATTNHPFDHGNVYYVILTTSHPLMS